MFLNVKEKLGILWKLASQEAPASYALPTLSRAPVHALGTGQVAAMQLCSSGAQETGTLWE
eukprot:12541462-Alexandrium_andersonii.AAC.1